MPPSSLPLRLQTNRILFTMKIWKPVCTELGRVLPVSYQTSFPSSWIFIKSAFYRDTEPGHKAGLGQCPGPLTREREVNQGLKTVGWSPDQHRNYRLSSRHIFSSFHSRDSTLGATQLLFFIRTLLCWPENKVERSGRCTYVWRYKTRGGGLIAVTIPMISALTWYN